VSAAKMHHWTPAQVASWISYLLRKAEVNRSRKNGEKGWGSKDRKVPTLNMKLVEGVFRDWRVRGELNVYTR